MKRASREKLLARRRVDGRRNRGGRLGHFPASLQVSASDLSQIHQTRTAFESLRFPPCENQGQETGKSNTSIKESRMDAAARADRK
jgi:hypothetical protein